MKQFEKIWLKGSCDLDIDCGDMDCRNCKDISEKWWKMALEWIRDTKYRDTDESLYDILEKEIGYDKNYLRLYGKRCLSCSGDGYFLGKNHTNPCKYCNGIGYVEKKK